MLANPRSKCSGTKSQWNGGVALREHLQDAKPQYGLGCLGHDESVVILVREIGAETARQCLQAARIVFLQVDPGILAERQAHDARLIGRFSREGASEHAREHQKRKACFSFHGPLSAGAVNWRASFRGHHRACPGDPGHQAWSKRRWIAEPSPAMALSLCRAGSDRF